MTENLPLKVASSMRSRRRAMVIAGMATSLATLMVLLLTLQSSTKTTAIIYKGVWASPEVEAWLSSHTNSDTDEFVNREGATLPSIPKYPSKQLSEGKGLALVVESTTGTRLLATDHGEIHNVTILIPHSDLLKGTRLGIPDDATLLLTLGPAHTASYSFGAASTGEISVLDVRTDQISVSVDADVSLFSTGREGQLIGPRGPIKVHDTFVCMNTGEAILGAD